MPAPPRSLLVWQACSEACLSEGSGGLRCHRGSHSHRPALRGKFANRPGQPGRMIAATNPRPAGFVRAAARPSLPGSVPRGRQTLWKRRLPGPGTPGAGPVGQSGLPLEASALASSPASRERAEPVSQGPRRTRQRAGPERPSRGRRALEGSRAPGRLSLCPGDSVGKPGPEPGGRTLLGRTWRERLPHGQGSKAPPPRGRDPQSRANLTDWKQGLPLTPRASFRCVLISSGPWAQRGF